MLGSTKLTAVLGSAPSASADNQVLKAYTKSLQRDAGLALFLVMPGSKAPADCRTTQARNKALKEAEEAGDPKPTGLHMATTNPTHLARWIDKYRKDREPTTPVNVAMEVGRSRLVVIDVDTPAELDAFRNVWADKSGDPNLRYVAPTVSSPGVFDEASQTWIHQGGGHFYFRLPEGYNLPDSAPGVLTYGEAGAQWVARIKDAYVLIPPSVRKEGSYWVSGTDHLIPDWLLADIVETGVARTERKSDRAAKLAAAQASGEADPIDVWSSATSWDDILEPLGWIQAGRADSCTCDIWTRPGNNPSPKSATAHNSGCSDGRFDHDNSPIHVWSDNVDGGLADWIHDNGKTLSKLQFVAAVHHGGDISAAMSELGLASNVETTHGEAVSAEGLASEVGQVSKSALANQLLEDSEPVAGLQAHNLTPAGMFSDPAGEEVPASGPAKAVEITDPAKPRLPLLAAFNHWRNLPPPEYIVDGWIEDQALSAVVGPSGVGKSAVVLDMACSIAMGIPWQGKTTKRSKVLYIAGEGGTGAAQRVKSWEAEHGLDVGEDLYMITEAVLIGSKNQELWPWLADQVRELDIRLVIFDTLARMSLGLEENSASDMGSAVARFDRLRREGETGVMVVHHTARGQSHGRGSTAILGALDSEVLVQSPDEDEDDEVSGQAKHITATVTKQKNAADGEELQLTLCQRHGSIVVADATGATGDPFAAPVLEFARPVPETDTELAIRVAEYLEPLPMQGATKTDITRDVIPSKAYRTNQMAWKSAVLRAVDRGLATGLLQTFGTDAAQRYVKGSGTAAQAYALDKAEAEDRAATGSG